MCCPLKCFLSCRLIKGGLFLSLNGYTLRENQRKAGFASGIKQLAKSRIRQKTAQRGLGDNRRERLLLSENYHPERLSSPEECRRKGRAALLGLFAVGNGCCQVPPGGSGYLPPEQSCRQGSPPLGFSITLRAGQREIWSAKKHWFCQDCAKVPESPVCHFFPSQNLCIINNTLIANKGKTTRRREYIRLLARSLYRENLS